MPQSFGLRSIRARISVGVGLVAAAVLLPLTAMVWVQLEEAAGQTATRLAEDDLQPYAADLQHQPDERPDAAGSGVLILVVDPRGTVRRDSMPADLVVAARATTRDRPVTTREGRFQLATTTVSTAAGTWRLWAARDLSASAALLQAIRLTTVLGASAGTVAAAVGGWWVAGRALRPVERLRVTAERLRADHRDDLLPLSGDDEVGRLSRTLNGLLSGLRLGIAHERELTANVAHELRTPLAVLTAQVEVARRHGSPDLGPIEESLRHLTVLTDNLLALARADLPPSAPVRRSPISELTAELMRAIDRARVIASSATFVDLIVGEELDPRSTCRIDPIDFGRILDNLLSNAVHHAGPATAITASMTPETDRLLLRVEDDGVGFPTDLTGRAFDRFARSDTLSGSDRHGAGLGLALVRHLARAAGGDATLQTGRGAGCVVEVRIPVTPPSEPEAVSNDVAAFEHSKPATVRTT